LQYANGTIFIGKAKVENVLLIKSMLRCFELVSSLKINFFKSSLGAIGVENDLLTRFAGMLNCRLMHISFLYLGIPVGAIHRKENTWQPIVDKFDRKLTSWKSKVLS
ncbi:hypothetical protein glysoja_040779, partial [Glycine soja]